MDSLPSNAPLPVIHEAMLPPAPDKVTPNSVTRSEMPAVRPPMPTIEDDVEGDRITHISDAAEVVCERDRIVLLRLDGVDAGKIWQIGRSNAGVGRSTGNELVLQDAGVSRKHARLVWNGKAHMAEDLTSRNGTFLRGVRITRAEIRDGDLIQFGPHAFFRYTVTDALQERLLRQLFESSTRDPLTGAYNRRHFDERLQAELAYATRHKADLSLVMLDIDHFKRVNDTRGHAAGDAVIRHLARMTLSQLRSEDVFARYGGEEFVMLLRGTSARDAVRVAERVRASAATVAATFEGHPIPITVSAGCACLWECPNRTPGELLAAADGRLYAAKRAGRNRVLGPGSKSL